ncbi:hypothetical protein EPN81_03545 [Patescibacteria group bacterium]|nr:MAG: hypothetical protein EPN81_03545 [Patescibacteria group bacterium]
MMRIPHTPQELHLQIDRLWDGSTCPDDRLHADAFVSQTKEGILFRVDAPMLYDQKVPDAPMGTRVEKLWEFDVVELFLVGPGHRYLEVELGAGGHFLALGFDSIRHPCDVFESFSPVLRFEKTSEKLWKSSLTIPWKMVPENLRALNAFAIMAGQFLAYSPVPGQQPDYHQPDRYPSVSL